MRPTEGEFGAPRPVRHNGQLARWGPAGRAVGSMSGQGRPSAGAGVGHARPVTVSCRGAPGGRQVPAPLRPLCTLRSAPLPRVPPLHPAPPTTCHERGGQMQGPRYREWGDGAAAVLCSTTYANGGGLLRHHSPLPIYAYHRFCFSTVHFPLGEAAKARRAGGAQAASPPSIDEK